MKTAGYYPKSRLLLPPKRPQLAMPLLSPKSPTGKHSGAAGGLYCSTSNNLHHRMLHFSTKGVPSKAEREYFGLSLRGGEKVAHSFAKDSLTPAGERKLLLPTAAKAEIMQEHFNTEATHE